MEKIWIKKDLYILNYEFLKFYAFFRFLYNFKLIFPYWNCEKGDLLPAGADMASGSSGELTRRRWGHVAELWVANAGRRRRTVRGHVAGGHASTRVHVGARVARHVAVRSEIGGPTGIVGPGKIVGAVTRKCYTSP